MQHLEASCCLTALTLICRGQWATRLKLLLRLIYSLWDLISCKHFIVRWVQERATTSVNKTWCCGGISGSWCWSKWRHQYNPTAGCQGECTLIWMFLSQHFQQKLRCLNIKTESKTVKDYMDIGNWYVQLWNTFQRCPWQLKFITLLDNKTPNRDRDRNIDFMSRCNSSLYSSDLFIFHRI